jgi:transcriptional regulator with XRE-family HTH domain
MEALREMTPLRLRRLALGWPQWQLARASGVSLHKISFAERGLLGVLSLADRRRLAATLDSEVRALFPDVECGAWGSSTKPLLALGDGAAGLPVERRPEAHDNA